VLSQPAVHRRFTGAEGGWEPTMLPEGTAGAQDTAVTPMACALGIWAGTAQHSTTQHSRSRQVVLRHVAPD
jgi:hypothetical protein